MAYSQVVRMGDGSTTEFTVEFALGRLNADTVTCRVDDEVDGTGQPLYRPLTWISASRVRVGGGVVPAGGRLLFSRTTPKDRKLVNFKDGDVLDEENLDIAFNQVWEGVHEVLDGRFSAFNADMDLGGFRVKNIGDPLDPKDAANKDYVDARIQIGENWYNKARQEADRSTTQANASASSASRAATSEQNAKTSETNAKTSENAARADALRTSADATKTGQDAAKTAADRVQTGQDKAATAADRVQTGQDRTATAADRVATGQDKAATNADRVQTGLDRVAAASSKTNADLARDMARKWATEAIGTPVNDGVNPEGFSAYHWAQVAAGAVAGALEEQLMAFPIRNDPADTDEVIVMDGTGKGHRVPFSALNDLFKLPFDPVDKAGDTMTGPLIVPNLTNTGGNVKNNTDGRYAQYSLNNADGSERALFFHDKETGHAYIRVNGKVYTFGSKGTLVVPEVTDTTAANLGAFYTSVSGGAYAAIPNRVHGLHIRSNVVGNTYAPAIKLSYGTSMWNGHYSFGIINKGNNNQPASYQIIYQEDTGANQKNWYFEPDGRFTADNHISAGAAQFQTNGNIVGSIWSNWGSSDAYTAINNRIEQRARDWAVQEGNRGRDEVLNRGIRPLGGGFRLTGDGDSWTNTTGALVVVSVFVKATTQVTVYHNGNTWFTVQGNTSTPPYEYNVIHCWPGQTISYRRGAAGSFVHGTWVEVRG